MARLIYASMTVSLDGFFEDADGGIGWSTPEDELHRASNEQVASLAAIVMGRRLYDVMVPYWHDLLTDPAAPEVEREFAQVWDRLPKYVASRTLTDVHPSCELIVGDAIEWIAQRKADTDGDIEVSGVDLAAQVEAAGLIDAYRFNVAPVLLGAGNPLFRPGTRRDLELTETRRFPGGTVALEYAVRQ
ncbi:MAG: dihydrofolate reductase family protein [Gordonia sp. (in: high G+C Gram-positive bacteria)]|uniref:dihydrofolate reductase family protein n=1 Tax=Gordonia sp. (in: high G+C Gram-positive bacteria) TaxID=84139 RepID=UPI0039E36B43